MLSAKTFEAGSSGDLENEVNTFLMKNPNVHEVTVAYAVERRQGEPHSKLPMLEYHNCIIFYER